MKLLHVTPYYLPAVRYGGPIHSVHGLCKGLAARGHEVHVFTTNVDGAGESRVPLATPVDIDGVHVWYFRSPHLRRLFRAPMMWNALQTHITSFQLVHLHTIFLWPTWAAAHWARQSSVPYVLAPRGMLVQEMIRRKSRLAKTAWIRLVERQNLEHACAIHVTSEQERSDIAAFGFRLPPAILVPNGVHIDFNESTSVSALDPLLQSMEKPYVLFIGRINWKKGLDRLLDAIRQVPNVRLLVAGNDEDGYRSVLDKKVMENNLADRVQFVGPVYDERKSVLLRNALALVLPSYNENFGNAALEAMAAARPVIVTPEVGLAAVVRAAGAGIVAEGSAEGIGQAIACLASNCALGDAMGEKGRRSVSERFSWGVVCEQMEAHYTSLLREAIPGSYPVTA